MVLSIYERVKAELKTAPKTWLVTGVAGFIGSHLLETLLDLEQRVIGLDNFSTGHQKNLEAVRAHVSPLQWEQFSLLQGDISDFPFFRRACVGADFLLHHAALSSAPGS